VMLDSPREELVERASRFVAELAGARSKPRMPEND
jgi:hypothetical protein